MKKITALTLGSMIMMNSVAFAFSDLTEEHWAYRNVLNMQEKGIISGFADNTFKPNDALTRAQFITMAVKALGKNENIAGLSFDDVKGHWAEEYIEMAGEAMGIIPSETTNGFSFEPDKEALREDVAMALVLLNNLAENKETNFQDKDLEVLKKFSDSESISEGKKIYVAIAVENGLMSGNADGSFCPKKPLTRAEGATVIFNALNIKANLENSVEDEAIVNWDGEYVSNIDGLVKVKLTKLSDTEVNFYIKGKTNDKLLFGTNNNAQISGDTAKYTYESFDDKGEINFKFEGKDLIIETTGYEALNILAGRYKINDGSISEIKWTIPRNPIEGEYLMGEEIETPNVESFEDLEKILQSLPNSVTLEISNVENDSATFVIGGFVDGGMILTMDSLKKVDDKWKYFDEYEGKYTIEISFEDGKAIVKGLIEDEEKLSGTYVKKGPESEYEKYDNMIDEGEIGEGVFFF